MVVFKYPHDTCVDYIKRIIGLPGDRIQVKDGQLYINGELCPRVPEGNYLADDNGIKMMRKLYVETLPNGVKHDILKERDDGWVNNTQEYVVPDDHVFAMGDNRDNSADSRFMDGVGYHSAGKSRRPGGDPVLLHRLRIPVVGILGMAVRDPLEPAAQARPLNTLVMSEPFEAILGYAFKRPALLKEALTHSSVAHSHGRKQGSNERLEFIGDRVLGLMMAEWLAERFPREQEGELGPRLAHLVSQPVLATVADSIGLAEALSVGPGEVQGRPDKARHRPGGRAGGRAWRALP